MRKYVETKVEKIYYEETSISLHKRWEMKRNQSGRAAIGNEVFSIEIDCDGDTAAHAALRLKEIIHIYRYSIEN